MAEEGSNGWLPFDDAVRRARQSLESVTGRRPEGVSGANRIEDGRWIVALDVVELARIPPSTDVLATYEITLDPAGELVEMARVRRFMRAQASED